MAFSLSRLYADPLGKDQIYISPTVVAIIFSHGRQVLYWKSIICTALDNVANLSSGVLT